MATPQESLPAGVTLFGGVPLQSQDLAASLVFLLAFVLLLPAAAYRLIKPETRHRVLIKPVIFTTIRIASYGIRAGEANGNYSIGLFIAEQILVLCGGLMLVEPVAQLLEKHIGAKAQRGSDESIPGLIKLLRLMRMGLIAAMALGIYAGTQYSTNMSASDISDVHQYRLAGGGIGVGVSGLLVVLSLFCSFAWALPARGTAWIVIASALMCLTSSYKLYIVLNTESPFARSTKIAFYILSGLPEWIVAAMMVFTPLPAVFPRLLEKDPYALGIGGRIKERFGMDRGYDHYSMDRAMAQRPQPVNQQSYVSEADKSYA